MPSNCIVCNSPDRAEIENAILSMTTNAPPNGANSIEAIAKQYGVPLDELKMHALFHTPLVGDNDVSVEQVTPEELGLPSATAGVQECSCGCNTAPQSKEPRDSLTRRLKLREADMLAAVGNEYLVTLKTMGRRINKLAQVSSLDIEDEEKQLKLAKLLTKPMVDLYVGLGGEVRQTVKTMAELDRMLNGPEENATSGLVALAKAIQGSDRSDG
uniref:Uncharacterized protein n=1 Tax=Myoviridae sp. ct4uh47 TaxID=2825032 RepID=A0A8S5V613_9CAUD|nr:MAG TPA: hypothetical protein [Myoviridae sp. ct4uh47]